MMTESKEDERIGQMRYKADVQQYGGLCLFFSTLIAIFSLTDIAALCGAGEGNTPKSELPLFYLISSILLCLVGLVGMIQGYLIFVMNEGFGRFSIVCAAVTQVAWLPFLASLIETGKRTTSEFDAKSPSFLPAILNPTPTHKDVKFVGAMDLISIIVYYAAFIGSLAFAQFAIDAYGKGKASTRFASFFRVRSLYYNGLVVLAGLSQLLLGSYLVHNFGGGPYKQPVVTQIYTVYFPEFNIVVGIVQFFVGTVGVTRRFHLPHDAESVDSIRAFQLMCGFMWFTMLTLQNLVQNAYGGGIDAQLDARATTLGLLYLPLAMMPAFIDYKMYNLPEAITTDYYGAETEKVAASEGTKAETKEKETA